MGKKELKNCFFCTVTGAKQIFIPTRLQTVLDIKPGDIIRLDLFTDMTVGFSRDAEESAAEHAQPEKDKKDARIADDARKKK